MEGENVKDKVTHKKKNEQSSNCSEKYLWKRVFDFEIL